MTTHEKTGRVTLIITDVAGRLIIQSVSARGRRSMPAIVSERRALERITLALRKGNQVIAPSTLWRSGR